MLVKEEIILNNRTFGGETLTAKFLPGKGMNLASYKKNELEIIDQTTLDLFEERFAGLGALIGPHFHHRSKIPPIKHESLFPHIERLKAKGVKEPFSHGIGRYAPWKVEKWSDNTLEAVLSGADVWNHTSLAELEGQEFEMRYIASLLHDGLHITLKVKSEQPSVVGLHTYYSAPHGGEISAKVQNIYNDQGALLPLPQSLKNDQTMTYDIQAPIDLGYFPFPDPKKGSILLNAKTHRVRISYETPNDQNSFQLWHPPGKTFVCIEPLSAKIPKEPILKKSQITVHIEILP